ncbi:MAG: PqqD family protein [Desulfobacteraceae bacterium]|jgi:hypothetical protein
MLDFTSNVMLNDKVVSTMVDGEIVMMDADSGSYYALNSVGTFIWELVKERRKVGDIAIEVARAFDVVKEKSDQELVQFLEKLMSENLVIMA